MVRKTKMNRGFKNPRAVRLINPKISRPYAGGISLPGAPKLGRRERIQEGQEWPPPPDWWPTPTSEWIVYWYLTERKHFKEGVDFYYQAPVFLPYLFSSRDFTRVDFLLDLGPSSRIGTIDRYTALCFDPITNFTHPNPAFDKARRAELDTAGYLLIFLEDYDIKLRPKAIIESALRGRDESSRR